MNFKYKAWDETIKHMYLSDNKHLVLEINGRCFNLQTGAEVLPLFYIGLTNKRGIDICEGDLIKIPEGYCGDYHYEETIAEVRWDAPKFYAHNLSNKDGCTMQDFSWNEVEVMGNIYENN